MSRKPRKKYRRTTREVIGEQMLSALELQIADQKLHQTLVLQKITAIGVDQGMSLVRIATALEHLAQQGADRAMRERNVEPRGPGLSMGSGD